MAPENPALTSKQISEWISSGADDARRGYPPGRDYRLPGQGGAFGPDGETARRLKKARRALERAEAKNTVKMIKPLRSLRRDQNAVNEALIDSLRSVLGVNRELLRGMELLQLQLDDLEAQLAAERNLRLAEPTERDSA